jgi:hypothetical protein
MGERRAGPAADGDYLEHPRVSSSPHTWLPMKPVAPTSKTRICASVLPPNTSRATLFLAAAGQSAQRYPQVQLFLWSGRAVAPTG